MKKTLLLGSQSPRRRELLHSLGYDFEVVSISCEETYPQNLPIEEVAGYLSQKKAQAYPYLLPHQVLITADTIVTYQGAVLGKPKDTADAQRMLRLLSGDTHQVYTGITIKSTEAIITKIDRAEVTFAELTDEEIDYYIQNHHPMDKAGGYGVQDWLGMAKIAHIRGSFYTIMGLPTHILYQELQNFL